MVPSLLFLSPSSSQALRPGSWDLQLFVFLSMPIAEVALTGVLIECCVGTELWALRARTGVDGVLRDVLPLSGVCCLHLAFKCFFFFFRYRWFFLPAKDMVPSSVSEFRLAPSFHCVQLSALLTQRFLLPSLAFILLCS